MKELGNGAHHKREMKEISSVMVKQNLRVTTVRQAAMAKNQPREEQVRRDFLKNMRLIDGISMSLSRFTIEE